MKCIIFSELNKHIGQTPERVKRGINTTALPRQYKQAYHIPYQWNTLVFPNVTLTVSRLAWSPWEYRLKPIQTVPCQEKKNNLKSYNLFVSREHWDTRRYRYDPYTYCLISNSRKLWPLAKDKAPTSIWRGTYLLFACSAFSVLDLVLIHFTHQSFNKAPHCTSGEMEKPQHRGLTQAIQTCACQKSQLSQCLTPCPQRGTKQHHTILMHGIGKSLLGWHCSVSAILRESKARSCSFF